MDKQKEIPVIIHKGDAGYLSEQIVSFTNRLGFNHLMDEPYRIMFAEDGDVILRPWKVPDVVFHYCSLDTFKAILNSKALLMGDARFSNDKKELYQSIMVLSEHFKKLNFQLTDGILDNWELEITRYKERYPADKINEIEQNIKTLRPLSVETRTILYRQNLDNVINEFYKNLKDVITNQNPIYIACFCEQGDVKSQWMEYADKGKGVSIGFKVEQIKNFKETFFSLVHYFKNELDELINEKLTDFAFNPKSIKEWQTKVLPVVKHEMWREEKEWRLIHNPPQEIKEHTFQHRVMNNRIYYELSFQPEFISKIILGPDCDMDENKIMAMLKNDYGIELNTNQIEKSKLPLQNSKNKEHNFSDRKNKVMKQIMELAEEADLFEIESILNKKRGN